MCYNEKPVYQVQRGNYTLKIWSDNDPGINPITDLDILGSFYNFDNPIYNGLTRTNITNEKPGFKNHDYARMWLDENEKDIGVIMYFSIDSYGLHKKSGTVSEPPNHYTGFWYISMEDCVKEWGKGIGSESPHLKAEKYMSAMLDTLDDYYQGIVYGWTVVGPDLDAAEGCWGYIGDYEKSGCFEEGMEALEGAYEEELSGIEFESKFFHV